MRLGILCCLFSLMACQSSTPPTWNGAWRVVMDLDSSDAQAKLPFHMEMGQVDGAWHATIFNADERIEVSNISIQGDSMHMQLPVFDSYFIAQLNEEGMQGHWYNRAKGPEYRIPFVAHKNIEGRFIQSTAAPRLAEQYAVQFNTSGNSYEAIGQFQVRGDAVYGTFITETGDYRFLEGAMDHDELMLSCFDGAHAFLFRATRKNDSLTQGSFWSGTHYKTDFIGHEDPDAGIGNPELLTYLKPGYNAFEFEFSDLMGKRWSLEDSLFADRPTIIQIMGTWCPNCMDETRFLNEVRDSFPEIAVVALAFEIAQDSAKVLSNLQRFKRDLGVDYPVLFAGKANKKAAAQELPMLNHVMSYPTTIYLDRDHRVGKIFTGFYGPGTGNLYAQHRVKTMEFIEQLLTEVK